MKTAMYALIGSMCLLTSCVDDDKDLSVLTIRTADLVIPDGFDWSTTRSLTLATNAPHATSATVYLDEACSEQIADLAIPEGNNNVSLEIPSANHSIWIKYPVSDGSYETQKISIKAKTATRSSGAFLWTADCLFPDRAQEVPTDTYTTHLYQPGKNVYGTLMFEDMWPEMGDYDFNDFVINYQVHASWGGKPNGEKNNYWDIAISLKLRAMGGSLPYRFCIKLPGNATDMEGDPISVPVLTREQIQGLQVSNAKGNIGVELIENTQEPIFALTGLDQIRGTEGKLYNTQIGNLINNENTVSVSFSFKLMAEDAYGLTSAFNAYFFDYFLQNTENGREIHFVGFKPSELYKNYGRDQTGEQKNYYCNEKGFVWALKAPVEMGWAVEKTDLLTVYPKFKSWLENGGYDLEDNVEESKWYNYPQGASAYIDHKKH